MNTLKSIFEEYINQKRDEALLVKEPIPLQGMPLLCSNIHTGLNLIAARPSMGATSLAASLAVELIAAGKRVLYYSFPHHQVEKKLARVFAHYYDVDFPNPVGVDDPNAVFKAFDEKVGQLGGVMTNLYHQPLYYNSMLKDLEGMMFKTLSRSVSLEQKIDYIIIDGIQDIHTEENLRNLTTPEYVCEQLRSFSYQCEVPIIATSQINPSSRGFAAEPELEDFRGGALEQYARLVYFLYRPDYYNIVADEQGNDLRGYARVIIAKNADGIVGEVEATYDGVYNRIYTEQTFAQYIEDVSKQRCLVDLRPF